MKIAYECWIKKVRVGELIQRAIFKTIIDHWQLSVYHLSKFLTSEHEEQHGLCKISLGKTLVSTSRKQKRDILSHHIRLFMRAIADEVTCKYIFEQYKCDDTNQLTYGHAMAEFCWFRLMAYKFLYNQFKKFQAVQRLQVF